MLQRIDLRSECGRAGGRAGLGGARAGSGIGAEGGRLIGGGLRACPQLRNVFFGGQ